MTDKLAEHPGGFHSKIVTIKNSYTTRICGTWIKQSRHYLNLYSLECPVFKLPSHISLNANDCFKYFSTARMLSTTMRSFKGELHFSSEFEGQGIRH